MLVVAFGFCAVFPFRVLLNWFTGRRDGVALALAQGISKACERLGGAFTKMGQILSTRADLFPPRALEALAVLQDRVPPAPFSEVQSFIFEGHYPLQSVQEVPIASGSIAQVHLAVDGKSERPVAIKVRRPGITELMLTDIACMQFMVRLVSKASIFKSLPLTQSVAQVCETLLKQTDFRGEATRQRQFARTFTDVDNVKIAEVIPEACSDNIIVMEYLNDFVPFTALEVEDAKVAACTAGLHALFKMLFEVGLIHGDMHGGNVLANADGTQIGLLDFGFAIEVPPATRREFAKFFQSIYRADGKKAAVIIRDSALKVPDDFDYEAFEVDMSGLVERSAGKKAQEFQVTAFGAELFQIQRKHGMLGSPDFTLPILALLTYEGLVKNITPQLDFQKEAIPFTIRGLSAGL